MKIDIICPLYNAKSYMEGLDKSLKKQKNVEISSINYVVTKTGDGTELLLDKMDIQYTTIDKNQFSHSLTRENTALACTGDIYVFITQDIIIESEYWLYELTEPIIKGEAEAAYSRQLCTDSSIERYTRLKNYPDHDTIQHKDLLDEMGLLTFFFSDATCAISAQIYRELGAYDGKKLPTSEDMYIAYKIIMAGYRIKYCSKSEVIHFHNFTLREMYERYKLIGIFFQQETYLNQYKVNGQGKDMAIFILKNAISELNVPVLCRFLPDMVARYLGMKNGKRLHRRNNG